MIKFSSNEIKNDITHSSSLNKIDHAASTSTSTSTSTSASASASASAIAKIQNSQASLLVNKSQVIKSKIMCSFRQFFNKTTIKDPASEHECSGLIGITIYPKLAKNYEGEIIFDGTGKITALRKNSITRDDYNILIKNRIKPLNETPVILKDRIRTPGEAIIDVAGLINKSGHMLDNKQMLEEQLKCTWLDGLLSKQSFYNIMELMKIKIGTCSDLISGIDGIMSTLETDFFVTKRNDNYYGRLFESELSKYIVDNPSDNMLKVRNDINKFILSDFLKQSKEDQLVLCNVLSKAMDADPPSWRYDLLFADNFIDKPTPLNFIEMINFKEKYSVPLLLSTAVKYIVLSKGTRQLKNKATQYYVNKILPQRQLINSLNASKLALTDYYGLLLTYQKSHPSANKENVGLGIRPIDKYMRPSAGIALTEHDTAALASERTIGIGISGSSNILHFLFQHLQSQNSLFPLDDAKLATTAWLSYSGGHSFNEAYSVFGFMTEGNFKPLSFNVLKTSSALSKLAVSYAYNKVIEASIALNP